MGLFKKGLSVTLAALTMSAAIPLNNTAAFPAASAAQIIELRVNYCKNPVAVDSTPYFSWQMESPVIGQKQTAYKVTVKDETAKVVWDSGKTVSDQSLNIEYAGETLKPSCVYTWSVTVWDKDGISSTSAEKATFETGLIEQSAFDNAHWLQIPKDDQSFVHFTLECDMTFINDAVGIVFSAKDSGNFLMWQFNTNTNAQGGRRDLYLRPHFWVNSNVTVENININDKLTEADIKNVSRHVMLDVTGQEIKTYVDGNLINTFSHPGAQLGEVGFRACHDNASNEQGLLDNLVYTIYDESGAGKEQLNCDFDSGDNPFEDGTVADGKLSIAQPMDKTAVCTAGYQQGLPMFRKAFLAQKDNTNVKSVKLYTAALGIYELYYNGRRVGRQREDGSELYDELKPGWTDYNKRVLYDAYDLTDATLGGKNALLAMTSPGWWCGKIAKDTYGNSNTPAFIAKLIITYDDESRQEINTDGSWKCLKGGPVLSADIYDGETYDARLWDETMASGEFDDSGWKTPAYGSFKGKIEANPGTYVRVKSELTRQPETAVIYDYTEANGSDYGKIHITDEKTFGDFSLNLKKGETAIIDFGQNQVGRPVFSLNAEAGTKVTLHFAEMLNDSGKKSRGNDGPEGSLYTTNYRSAKSTNTYYAGGGKNETYRALHTFFGYRYISITADRDVAFTSLYAEVIGSDTAETGTITTSSKLVNQLISNITWGQRGNYLSVATDCPQRDERLGWSGDTEFFIGAATYNADVAAFYNKWAGDCSDSQQPNGAYTDTIPASYANGSGNTAWADAGIIVPHTLYKMYNNRRLLEKNYPSMQKYMSFLSSRGYQGAYPGFGDWLSYEATDGAYISMAYYAQIAQCMSDIAAAIGKTADSEKYQKLYDAIKQKFNLKYVNADGTLKIKTQTAYLLALKIHLLPGVQAEENAARALVKRIESNRGLLSTGFVGTSTIAQTLGEYSYSNAAYSLLLQRKNPSWLYSVDQGATTVWERWNSYTKENGFGDASMNSFNHYSFGAVQEWMYRYMAGIETASGASFKNITLQPQPDERTASEIPAGQEKITSVSASYKSVYGEIKSAWNTQSGVFDYTAKVPANTAASLKFPTLGQNATSLIINGGEVKIRGKKPGDALADGVVYSGKQGKAVLLALEPGEYQIKEGKTELFPVTKVTLNRTKLTLTEGEKFGLTALVDPADTTDSKAVSFSSSNGKIASASANGAIRALAAGNAVITARAAANPNIKAECAVTVKPKTILASKITLSKRGSKTLVSGGKTKLTAKLYPQNATDKKINFKTSDRAIAVVDSAGRVFAKSPGSVQITAYSGSATAKIMLKIVPKAPKIIKAKRVSKKSVKLTLAKTKAGQVTKYEYFVSKGGKKYKKFTASKSRSITVKRIFARSKYLFKARVYKLKKGRKYYSGFSKPRALPAAK